MRAEKALRIAEKANYKKFKKEALERILLRAKTGAYKATIRLIETIDEDYNVRLNNKLIAKLQKLNYHVILKDKFLHVYWNREFIMKRDAKTPVPKLVIQGQLTDDEFDMLKAAIEKGFKLCVADASVERLIKMGYIDFVGLPTSMGRNVYQVRLNNLKLHDEEE